MRLAAFTLLITALVGTSALMATTRMQDRSTLRKQADQLMMDGNWAEAWTVLSQLALDETNTDPQLSEDLRKSVECLMTLNRSAEFDDYFEQVVAAHPSHWQLLAAAATVLQNNVPHEGFLIAGQFQRGYHRGGGKMVTAQARDRVRSVQLSLQAIQSIETDDTTTARERSDLYKQLADSIGPADFSEAWKLQDLTDLTTLPDYQEHTGWGMPYGRGFGGFPRPIDRGAPVDENGNPVFHQLPESWNAATTDGQRWRWAMDQVPRTDRSRRSEIELQWAAFLQSQFGVSSASVGGPPIIPLGIETDDEQPVDSGVWAAHELADSETIAKLATGIKRFALPDEFNHIVLYQRILERKDDQQRPALEALINVRMNRHQYPQAAELLRSLLKLATEENDRKNVQSRLDQIVGNWLQFESTSVQPAGTGATIDLRFRNGSRVDFSAHSINIDALLKDVKDYLQSNPEQLTPEKLRIEDIGYLLIHGDRQKYLSDPVATWQLQLSAPAHHFDSLQTVTTPLQKAGAYWLTAKMADGNEARMVVWLADTAITRKRVEDGTLYFAADAVSGAGIAQAEFEFFGWRHERIGRTRNYRVLTKRFADRADANGICIPDAAQLDPHYQWLAIVRSNKGRLAFEGFDGVWNPERLDPFSYSPVKVYAITDRPVYRPGHVVKYRLWVRQPRFSEDAARFADQDFIVEVRNPKGEVVQETKVHSDRWGGIDGEYPLAADATLGSWQLRVCEPKEGPPQERAGFGVGTFQVEEYRKPEYEVTVEAPEKPVMLGEAIQAKVNARYYFGAPVAEGTVHYKVERTKKDHRWYPAARWDWLYSPGYWWFAPNYEWYPGWSRWGCLAPIPPWRGWQPDPPEVVVEGDAELSPDGSFLIDIDTASALREHSDSDHNFSITAEVVDKSRRTIIGTGNVLVAREPYRVFVWTDRGHYRTGDTVQVSLQARTPDGKPVSARGTAALLSVTYDGDKPVEQQVAAFDVNTDAQGTASLKLVIPEAGQFRISVSLTDEEGHQQEGGYVLFVRGPDADGRGYRFNDIELITEKRDYQPGERATLQINTNNADSTVLLFVRAANGLCPAPVVLKLNGKSTTWDLDIEPDDMPNLFVEALTIANGRIHSEVREIVVPPAEKVAHVEVLPAATRYRPGEQATIQLKLTDIDGQPFVGNTVLSVYDASLEYIAASAVPEIRSFFWNVRRHHNVMLQSTLQDTFGPLQLPNEVVMQPLWGTDPAMGGGFGAMQGRGLMRSSRGNPYRLFFGMDPPAPEAMSAMDGLSVLNSVEEFSVGAAAGKSAVQTAAAPEVQPTVRSNFADTAHWVASVNSDQQGIVEVSFTVPDNLTTWKVKAWTMGDGTRVGSGTADLISTKDLIIRPQTPRFFTETDQVTLSAVVHNYLETATSCRVVLEADGDQLQLPEDPSQTLQIPAGGEVRVDWNVRVVAAGTVTVRMKALTDTESDAAEYTVPVNVHGMRKTESYTGVIRPQARSASVTINVPEQRIEAQSRLEIRYSPSLAGAMVDALPYLIDYPYGCTEQTLNRFLPAVITQQTLKQMGVNLSAVKDQRLQLNAAKTYLGKYPDHWGQPPEIQTRDLRPLPAGFGMGSSTLATWIQQHLDDDLKKLSGVRDDFNPVFDEDTMNRIIKLGVSDLSNMQLSDGGWGWFSGYGEHSTAHMTSQVVHGLLIARDNGVPVLPDVLERGIAWLNNYQAEQLVLLREGDWRREHPQQLEKRDKRYRMQADNMDAFVAFVLSETNSVDAAMVDYLYRDRLDLSVYAKALTGLVLHSHEKTRERRDMLLRNIEQYLEQDDENQTAWLRMPQSVWWYWYGSEYEAMARYLQLLVRVQPQSEHASRLVKYLLNNRQNGTYWKSTRDTALVIEAMAEYIKATGEDKPNMTVEVVIDGTVTKSVEINAENFFSFDNSVLLEGDLVTSGQHQIELRRSGTGPLYFNAWLTSFTKEDHIAAAGLEIKVQRRFYRLERDDRDVSVQGDRGQVVSQQVAKFKRIPLQNLDTVTSGQLIEVELVLDSKNDYEYLLLEDPKPSGFETDDQRSGYVQEGLRAYRELRDDRVCFFMSSLARGQHSISYRLRAEMPSQQVSALPSVIEAMYAPELVGNSDEFKLQVQDRE